MNRACPWSAADLAPALCLLLDKIAAKNDPFVPVIKESREHAHWAGTESVSWTREAIEDFDVVVISTNHSSIDYQELSEWSDLIVDTRNEMKHVTMKNGHVWKA